MGQEIRILLVDDHILFRESLSRLLQAEPGFQVVGNSGSVKEAVEILNRESVDIVLLDYDLGEERGSSFLEESKRIGFTGRILMVTAGMSERVTLHALENGSSGVFLKHHPPAKLVEAIHKVVGGQTWLDPKTVRSLITGAAGKTEAQRSSPALNARERAVLKGVFEGFTNKEIAARLETTEGAVKAVMQQLFDKTGVRTRSHLVRIALEKHAQDWLTPEPER